jgi:hypothetical protein
MSQLAKGIFGAVAVSLALGAVPLAFGQDLAERWQAVADAPDTAINSAVNRSAKADRAPGLASPAAPTRTISLRVDSLADTSVLIRIPAARTLENNAAGKPVDKEVRNTPAAPGMMKSGDRKTTVACEPVVSVLTEVAKLLQPGRCVT